VREGAERQEGRDVCLDQSRLVAAPSPTERSSTRGLYGTLFLAFEGWLPNDGRGREGLQARAVSLAVTMPASAIGSGRCREDPHSHGRAWPAPKLDVESVGDLEVEPPLEV
jgi:hypothetical protein